MLLEVLGTVVGMIVQSIVLYQAIEANIEGPEMYEFLDLVWQMDGRECLGQVGIFCCQLDHATGVRYRLVLC